MSPTTNNNNNTSPPFTFCRQPLTRRRHSPSSRSGSITITYYLLLTTLGITTRPSKAYTSPFTDLTRRFSSLASPFQTGVSTWSAPPSSARSWSFSLVNNDDDTTFSDPDANLPLLEEWRVDSKGSVVGVVKNHPRIRDGDVITTSEVKQDLVVGLREGSVVETISGSRYRLMRQKGGGRGMSFSLDMFIPQTLSAIPQTNNKSPKQPSKDRPKDTLPCLDQWRILKTGEVVGIVSSHPAINDGDTITTSAITTSSPGEGKVVTTASGSRYKLLKRGAASETLRGKTEEKNAEQLRRKAINGSVGSVNGWDRGHNGGWGSFSLPESMSFDLPSMTKGLVFRPPWSVMSNGKSLQVNGAAPTEVNDMSLEDIPYIDEWRMKRSGAIVGTVKNHPSIRDGDTITTSSLADPNGVTEDKIVVTISGSRYKLLKESPLNKRNGKALTPRNGFDLFGLTSNGKEKPKTKEQPPEVKEENLPMIAEWRLTTAGTIAGIVSNHPRIKDGDTLTTSTLADVTDVKEGGIVTTKTGSRYKLLKELNTSSSFFTSVDVTPGAGGAIKKSLQDGLLPNGKTAGNGRYILVGEPRRTTSGRSQIWTAYDTDRNGNPTGDLLAIKMTSDFNRLSRESLNYDQVSTRLFAFNDDCFVSKSAFLPDAQGPGFETQSALVIDAGVKDLKELLNERRGRGLSGKAMRDCARLAGRCARACRSAGLVWTDLKSENFVLMTDADGDGSLAETLKGIDLESAMPVGRHPVDYSPEACPPEFAKSFVAGDVADFVLESNYDIWSLGMMLFEVSTGQPYFQGRSPSVITKELSREGFEVDVSSVRDEKLRDLIRWCLKTDPKKRPTVTQYLLHPYFMSSGFGGFGF